MNGKPWSEQDTEKLTNMYNDGASIEDIALTLCRTDSSVKHKAASLGLSSNIIKKNNPKYKAPYQNYDWCYERFINSSMTHEQMAEEAGTTLRTIQKWCSEKHGLNARTFKKYKKLSDIQRQLIMFSLLGDGHIDKREKEPLFIVSHSENQKDYLYWKHDILKDLCSSEPTKYDAQYKTFGNGKEYLCKPCYRFCTRIINDLIPIREMSKCEIIRRLNEFGICIHLLDDGYRSDSSWQVCVAAFSEEEKNIYINICKDKFGLLCHIDTDNRYIIFDANSSRKIDEIILSNIPNDLDVVKYKIVDKDICKPANYFYVHTDCEDIGLCRYCKMHNLKYETVKTIVSNFGYTEINEDELIKLLEDEEIVA